MRRYVIGIVGGIACGKSEISRMLKKCDADIISGDEIGHNALEMPHIINQMEKRWGRLFYADPESTTWEPLIHRLRKAVAKIVFEDKKELAFLESITGPIIRNRIIEQINLFHPLHGGLVVLDVPMLYELGCHVYCDEVWFVDMAESDRIDNFKKRPGAKIKDFRVRESRQWPLDIKERLANRRIANILGNPKVAESHIAGFISELKEKDERNEL